MIAMQTLGPQQVLKHVNVDVFSRNLLQDLGLDKEALRSEQEVQEFEAQQQQQQQLAQLQQGAQVAQDVGQAAKTLQETVNLRSAA